MLKLPATYLRVQDVLSMVGYTGGQDGTKQKSMEQSAQVQSHTSGASCRGCEIYVSVTTHAAKRTSGVDVQDCAGLNSMLRN